MTIERINFLEKERWSATYKLLLQAGLGVVCFFLLVYSMQGVQGYRLQKQVGLLKQSIAALQAKRESLLSATEEGFPKVGTVASLKTRILNSLDWYPLLADLSAQIPPNVWLVSFRSSEKQESPSSWGFVLNGQAREASGVSEFIANLKEIPSFVQVVLSESKKEGDLFVFSLECHVLGGMDVY